MADDWKKILVTKRVKLVENINLDVAMFNHLRATGIITAAARDEIEYNATPMEKVGRLLDYLQKRPEEDFKQFCVILQKTNQKHIVDQYLNVTNEASTAEPAQAAVPRPVVRPKIELMSEARKVHLKSRKTRDRLIEVLDLNDTVWRELIKKRIITEDGAKRIRAGNTLTEDQVGPFLDHLMRRPNKDFDAFCEILNENEQDHVVDNFLSEV